MGPRCNTEYHAFSIRLGARVRMRRQHLGLTQKELGERFQVADRYVSSIELGRRNLTLGLFLQLADALEMKLSELIRETEETTE